MKNISRIGLLLASIILMPACDAYLDTLPDNRAELNTEDKITKLLVSAYPNASDVMVREYYSDNVDSHDWNLNSNNFMEDLWNLKDNPNRTGNDNTYRSWEYHYSSIAACNEALNAIEKLGNPASMQAVKAEALVARAWNHFELASMFCLAYGENSANDMGLPYMTQPEVTVRPDYNRGTVAEFYQQIKADLEAGLPDINNSIYSQPKYHFNISAANAFATKFYIVYGEFDKAIACATRVLGNNPKQVLRNWVATRTMNMDNNEQPDAYINKDNPATLLVSFPISTWGTYGPNNYSSGNKYAHSLLLAVYETVQSKGPWGAYDNIYVKTWWNSNTNKLFHKKIGYYFEYTDAVARTGYGHTSVVHFTTDEVLLFRAEAYILTKQYAKAYEDLTTFITNYTSTNPSYEAIIAFYKEMAYHQPEEVLDGITVLQSPTAKKTLHPTLYKIEYGGEQELLLHYVLHLRRILLMGEGHRWLDVKRYGITVHRRLVDKGHQVVSVLDSIPYTDKRRAIQIPQEVINAGCPANPR